MNARTLYVKHCYIILITLLHHRFCEGPGVIKGGEMSYIPVLARQRMGKSPSYGACLFYWLHLFLSFQTQIFKKTASLQLTNTNPITFFWFLDMKHLS